MMVNGMLGSVLRGHTITSLTAEAELKPQNVTFYVSNIYKSQPINIFNIFLIWICRCDALQQACESIYIW